MAFRRKKRKFKKNWSVLMGDIGKGVTPLNRSGKLPISPTQEKKIKTINRRKEEEDKKDPTRKTRKQYNITQHSPKQNDKKQCFSQPSLLHLVLMLTRCSQPIAFGSRALAARSPQRSRLRRRRRCARCPRHPGARRRPSCSCKA